MDMMPQDGMPQDNDIRNQLLAELIDKMHERMASKMYPSDQQPMGDDVGIPADKPSEMPEMTAQNDDPGVTGSGSKAPMDGDMDSDEDMLMLEEMMKQQGA